MLTREMMGVFCLGVVWLTALLVAGAALLDLRDLVALSRRARKMVVGVAECDLAEWSVEQTARAIDIANDTGITFHERAFKSEVFGGGVRSGDVVHQVAAGKGHVWVSADARKDAMGCADVAAFDEVYVQARKAKGLRRDVRVRIMKGDRVYVVGEGEIVSTVDPRAFAVRKAWLVALFVPAELAVCAAVTWLAFQPPHFGRTSIVGALCCFAFFLGVTPLAVALREHIRRPHEAFLRPQWTRSVLEAAAVKRATPAQALTQRKT